MSTELDDSTVGATATRVRTLCSICAETSGNTKAQPVVPSSRSPGLLERFPERGTVVATIRRRFLFPPTTLFLAVTLISVKSADSRSGHQTSSTLPNLLKNFYQKKNLLVFFIAVAGGFWFPRLTQSYAGILRMKVGQVEGPDWSFLRWRLETDKVVTVRRILCCGIDGPSSLCR